MTLHFGKVNFHTNYLLEKAHEHKHILPDSLKLVLCKILQLRCIIQLTSLTLQSTKALRTQTGEPRRTVQTRSSILTRQTLTVVSLKKSLDFSYTINEFISLNIRHPCQCQSLSIPTNTRRSIKCLMGAFLTFYGHFYIMFFFSR